MLCGIVFGRASRFWSGIGSFAKVFYFYISVVELVIPEIVYTNLKPPTMIVLFCVSLKSGKLANAGGQQLCRV